MLISCAMNLNIAMQSTPMKVSVQSVARIEGGRAHEIAETRVFVITRARIERKRAQRKK